MKQNHLGGETPQKTQAKPSIIHIHGRRWFDKVNGNTYNTAEIWIDGEHVHKVEFGYGYDNHYVTRAADWLEKNGYTPNIEHYENGGHQPLWRYCQENGIKLITEVDDLPRKKDL